MTSHMQIARKFLETLGPDETMTTGALGHTLQNSHGAGPDILRDLTLMAANGMLGDCATKGPPELATSGFLKGKTIRRWRWHRPDLSKRVNFCPTCGQAIHEETQ